MSTGTIERTEKKDRRRVIAPNGNVVGAPPLPQVDLLPAATRAKHALNRVKTYLLLGLGLVVLGLLFLYVLSVVTASNAASELEIADTETRRLMVEQAKYAEVPKVLGQIEASSAAEFAGMQDEVLWASYIAEIEKVLPKDAQINEISSVARTPLEVAPLPAELLYGGELGVVQISLRTPTMPNTSEWLDSLNAIEGFLDASFSDQMISDEDGNVFYEVNTTLQLTEDALSGRFLPEAEVEAEAEATEETETLEED